MLWHFLGHFIINSKSTLLVVTIYCGCVVNLILVVICVCTLLGECLWWEGKCCRHRVLALSESECQWIVTHVSASLLRELEAGKLCHQLNMMWNRKNHYVWLYLYNGHGWVWKCCLVVQAVWVQIQISLVNVYRYLQPLPCLWEEYKYDFHEVKWKRVTLS